MWPREEAANKIIERDGIRYNAPYVELLLESFLKFHYCLIAPIFVLFTTEPVKESLPQTEVNHL